MREGGGVDIFHKVYDIYIYLIFVIFRSTVILCLLDLLQTEAVDDDFQILNQYFIRGGGGCTTTLHSVFPYTKTLYCALIHSLKIIIFFLKKYVFICIDNRFFSFLSDGIHFLLFFKISRCGFSTYMYVCFFLVPNFFIIPFLSLFPVHIYIQ